VLKGGREVALRHFPTQITRLVSAGRAFFSIARDHHRIPEDKHRHSLSVLIPYVALIPVFKLSEMLKMLPT